MVVKLDLSPFENDKDLGVYVDAEENIGHKGEERTGS
jgi:hypothetical protein